MDQHYFLTALGAAAALLTSLSYIPQVKKAWPRNSTKDVSLRMLLALTSGLGLWIVYGVMKSDWELTSANVVGALLAGAVLFFKNRDKFSHSEPSRGHADTK